MQKGATTDTAQVRNLARAELVRILDSVRGRTGLVLQTALSRPLSLIAEFDLLKDHGVEKIYHLSSGPLNTECSNLIYICRPEISHMKWIAGHIQGHKQKGVNIHYRIYFVPQRSLLCERILEEESVYGEVTIGEYHLDLVPLDSDLLSLEMDNAFRDLYLYNDTEILHIMAKAIAKVQNIYGTIPRIIGKGEISRKFVDCLLRVRREMACNAVDSPPASAIMDPQIDSMIVLERGVDMITPMCTQLTYEGLIDEVYGISSTFIEMDASSSPSAGASTARAATSTGSGTAASAGRAKKVMLNEKDPLFIHLRTLNFAVVGNKLREVAHRVQENYDERHNAKTVSQIKDFVGKLGNLQSEYQSLQTHTTLAQEIGAHIAKPEFSLQLELQQTFLTGSTTKQDVDILEDRINIAAPLLETLRLLCLYSLTENGIKPKHFDSLKRSIIQTYGYKHLNTLYHLQSTNLLKQQGPAKNPHLALKKSLRLVLDNVNEQEPVDISYVYSGFAPITARLVQVACFKALSLDGVSAETPNKHNGHVSWKSWEEALNNIPGPSFEELLSKNQRKDTMRHKHSTTLVVFLGGCTFTEVAALRFLAQKSNGTRDFLIVTTNMTNGTKLLSSLM
ncbi:Sec1-like protein [Phlyctochytrium arcticum]|nr:Sec1-like protein [Phlyctochytrium arcticum]